MELDEIWQQYRGRLRAFLHARVSNPSDVEELLQEISIKVFTGLSSLEDRSKLQSWLFQTANRTIIDFYRKSGREKGVHPDDLWYTSDDPEVREGLEGCVAPFINALPPDAARMMTEIELNGVSQQEYAVRHGLQYSTLKSRVQKARADLRDVFDECCQLSFDLRGGLEDYQANPDGCKKC